MRKTIILLLTLALPYWLSSVLYSQDFIPGNTYYDSSGYIEYRAGNLPIIISAPHGGSVVPSSIPDRSCSGCVTQKDSWTQTIAEGMYDAIHQQTGCYPHLIINLLHRKKFDANRDIGDAADGNFIVEQTWYGYHAFIDSAKQQTIKDYGRGLFLDIHGHAHTIQRIELGYLLSRSELQLSDSILNTQQYIEESSIRSLVGDNIQTLSHSELLRGQHSFGTLMEKHSFPSVPSTSYPSPLNNDPYFNGGYNTQRHGSRDNEENIDAIQIELNQDIRFNDTTREELMDSLATSSLEYINHHYNSQFSSSYCNLITSLFESKNSNYKFQLYPNPSKDYINLKSDLSDIDITIYNNLGQEMISQNWTGKKIEISHLNNGYYIVKLTKEHLTLNVLKLMKN